MTLETPSLWMKMGHLVSIIQKDQNPWAQEEIDVNCPEALIDEIAPTCFVDTDHSHDTVTRRSITGIVFFLAALPSYFRANGNPTRANVKMPLKHLLIPQSSAQ